MNLQTVMRRIGRDDVSVTFGVAPPGEIVGPLKPDGVYYGHAFGYDEHQEQFLTNEPIPLVTFSFNKYRPDLPPWGQVREFVLASEDDGEVVKASFIDTSVRGINTTGELKTVEMHAEGPAEGVDCAIIERDEIAEKRDMGAESDIRDAQSFKVNEELF